MTPTEHSGVLLHETDPTVGEMVVNTLQANPQASVAQVAVGLVRGAPTPEVAAELLNALVELTVCKHTGQVSWISQSAESVLTGIRRLGTRDALTFGGKVWPMVALVYAEPKSVTIDTGRDGRKRVWIASASLEGVVVKQTEAIALGNAIVELHGGRVLEDRQGPEVLKQSFVEQNMTSRAQARAEALNEVERLSLAARQIDALKPGHARTALIEAIPGFLRAGDRLTPENDPGLVYVVDRRLNNDWVSIVCEIAGPDGNAEADSWLFVDAARQAGIPAGMPNTHAGFTNEPAITAAVPSDQPGSPAEPPSADGA